MNERLKRIMIESGTHKYITEECQHRIEHIANLIVLECCHILDDMQTEVPGLHLYQPPTHMQIYRLKKSFNLED